VVIKRRRERVLLEFNCDMAIEPHVVNPV